MNQPAYPRRSQNKDMGSTADDSRSQSVSPIPSQESLHQTASQSLQNPSNRRSDHLKKQQPPTHSDKSLVPSGVGGGKTLEGVSSQATELLGNTLGSALVGGGQARGSGQKEALKLRLDLNLEVDVHITAKIHGDVTLSLFT